MTASAEPVVLTKKSVMSQQSDEKHGVFGNEGAEQRHLANLAVLTKDIITIRFFRPPLSFSPPTLLQDVEVPKE